MEEDYEDDYDEEDESGGLILSIGDDGKAELHKPDDYVQMLEKDFKLMQGFIEENKDAFNKYVAKNKTQASPSEKSANSG